MSVEQRQKPIIKGKNAERFLENEKRVNKQLEELKFPDKWINCQCGTEMVQCQYKATRIKNISVIFIPKEKKLIKNNNADICPNCGKVQLKENRQ